MDFDDGSSAYDPNYHQAPSNKVIPEVGEALVDVLAKIAGAGRASSAPVAHIAEPERPTMSIGTTWTPEDAPRKCPIRAAAETLAEFIGDPAYICAMKAALIETGIYDYLGIPRPAKKVEGAPPSLSASSAITAIQTALFDNWPGGKYVAGAPNRFGMAMEIWTCPAGEVITEKPHLNPSAKFSMGLMNYKSLKNQIKVLRKPRANPHSQPTRAYLDDLERLADRIKGTKSLVGLVNTTIHNEDGPYYRGVYYHPYQFALVEMEGLTVVEAKLILSMGDEEWDMITLAPFDTTDTNGNALPAKIIGQSRHDIAGLDDPSWATNG